MRSRPIKIGWVLLFLPLLSHAATPALTPEQEQQTFQLNDDLRIELVASEPMVQDPVAMAFDGDGRLWVVEMRGFMPDIDGHGETNANGRISILEDRNHDGTMDHSTVFMEGLLMPRAIAVTSAGVLIAENRLLWWATDRNHDGKADDKILVDAHYGTNTVVEHSPNGLWRGMDNWYYNAKSDRRYHGLGSRWSSERTEKRGQWGLSHDDVGRLFYNYNHSQLHADVVPPSLLSRNPNHQPTRGISEAVSTNQTVFPIRPTPAANRGYIPGTLDEEKRIRAFTSACAPLVYRGNALPDAYRGNAFVCEPVGNLIKRNVLSQDGVYIRAMAGSPTREFLASTDERFRPVFLADGPDGALYIADMYRGIIQHKIYMTPYLRQQTLERGLVQPIHQGRIWRIVAANRKRPTSRSLSLMSDKDLLECLADANGWWRDRAQQHLVEKNRSDLIPALRRMSINHTNPLARLHALWTLHGLNDEPTSWLKAVEDPSSIVQVAAIGMLAMPNELSDASIASALTKPATDNDPRLPLAVALAAGRLKDPLPLLAGIISTHVEHPVIRDAVMSSLSGHESVMVIHLWKQEAWMKEALSKSIFLEGLAKSIVDRRRPDEIKTLLDHLDASATSLDWRQRALLGGIAVHGIGRSFKPVTLSREPAILKHPNDTADRAVRTQLKRLEQIFIWPGHTPHAVDSVKERKLTTQEQAQFVQGRTLYLTICAACHGSDGEGLKPLGPPLVDSEWVMGQEDILIRILLHGMSGPVTVKKTRYQAPDILPAMPSLATLNNTGTAAVLTYVRRAWEHHADPVTSKRVSRIRIETQGRTLPWTEEELSALRKD